VLTAQGTTTIGIELPLVVDTGLASILAVRDLVVFQSEELTDDLLTLVATIVIVGLAA
jgi:hypothetical protein